MSSTLSFNSTIFRLSMLVMFCLFIQLPIECKANTTQIQSIEKLNISNKNLKKKLKRIQQGEQPTLTEGKAINLLKTALYEPNNTQEIVDYLLDFFEKKDYSFSKHEVMLEALESTPVSLVKCLLKKGIYDVNYLKVNHLKKEVHNHHFFSNISFGKSCIRVATSCYKLDSFKDFFYKKVTDNKNIRPFKDFLYKKVTDNKNIRPFKDFLYKKVTDNKNIILLKDFFNKKKEAVEIYMLSFIPKYIYESLPLGLLYKISTIFIYPTILFFISYLFPDQILVKSVKKIYDYYSRASYIYIICKLLYIYHIGQKIDIRENYLFSVLSMESRTRKEKQDIIFTLLKHGASPHTKVFYIKEKETLGLRIREELSPNTYQELSVLHQAAKLDLLPLVKELIKRKVDINIPATFMQDTITLPATAEPTPEEILKALYYVPIQDIYNKKGPNFVYKTPLDFAPRGSQTAQYLKEQGGKYYKDLKT